MIITHSIWIIAAVIWMLKGIFLDREPFAVFSWAMVTVYAVMNLLQALKY